MLFITSDTHFYHEKIIGYCNRPFPSVRVMNEAIVSYWNTVVGKKDVVIHLGDVGFGKAALEVVQYLNGAKFLVRGNHDKSFSNNKLINSGFQSVYEKATTIIHIGTHSVIPVNLMHSPEHFTPNEMNLCGHVHSDWKKSKLGILNVGIDVRDFAPVPLKDLVIEFEEEFPGINIHRTRNREFCGLYGGINVLSSEI